MPLSEILRDVSTRLDMTAERETLTMELVVETEIVCPHCGETFSLTIDTSQATQSFIEDCTVCCRPINLSARCKPGEIIDLTVRG